MAQAEWTWVPGSALRWFTRPKTVIHPGTNRAWSRPKCYRWAKPATKVLKTSRLYRCKTWVPTTDTERKILASEKNMLQDQVQRTVTKCNEWITFFCKSPTKNKYKLVYACLCSAWWHSLNVGMCCAYRSRSIHIQFHLLLSHGRFDFFLCSL